MHPLHLNPTCQFTILHLSFLQRTQLVTLSYQQPLQSAIPFNPGFQSFDPFSGISFYNITVLLGLSLQLNLS